MCICVYVCAYMYIYTYVCAYMCMCDICVCINKYIYITKGYTGEWGGGNLQAKTEYTPHYPKPSLHIDDFFLTLKLPPKTPALANYSLWRLKGLR